MSRGLGKLQQAIVTHMARRRGVANNYAGAPLFRETHGGDFVMKRAPGFRRDHGFLLSPGWHDMRRVLDEVQLILDGKLLVRSLAAEGVTIQTRARPPYRYGADKFSRAVRALARAGIVEFPGLIPLDVDEIGIAERLSDGLYLSVNLGNRRFGRLTLTRRSMLLDADDVARAAP